MKKVTKTGLQLATKLSYDFFNKIFSHPPAPPLQCWASGLVEGAIPEGKFVRFPNIVMGGGGGLRCSTILIFSDVVIHEKWQTDKLFICLLKIAHK